MEHQQTLVALAGILVIGIGCQWAAGRLKLPSILLLLFAGLCVGPISGFLKPDQLLGELLLPLVSLAIAVILFEGAMTLRMSELKVIGRPLLLLLTVGVAITWCLAAFAARYILNLGWADAVLLGSILTVTGPTVVGPMLRHIRPIGKVGPLARWEGIVIDPVGAVLAVLTFAALRAQRTSPVEDAALNGAIGFVLTFLIGSILGYVAARILSEVLRRHWVSDHLDSPLTLAFVVLTFTAANVLHHEAGLVAVTVMGLVLANQHSVSVTRIISFKENLTVLLVSSLFVVLTARLDLQAFASAGWRGVAFVAAMILFVRPISVLLSTIGCGMKMSERLFLSWLAPRGIVAAAVASVFAADMPNGDSFVAAVFLVIVGTVVVYGLTAGRVSNKLGLSVPNPQGVLIVSAHPAARAIGAALMNLEIPVRLVDTNRDNIAVARMEGLPTFFGNILSEQLEDLELGGIGRMFAMTQNPEVNLLSVHRGAELFERKECYRLTIESAGLSRNEVGREALVGQVLFDEHATYNELDNRFASGATVKSTKLSAEFTLEDFQSRYPTALPLFVVDSGAKLTVITANDAFAPDVDDTIVALVESEA